MRGHRLALLALTLFALPPAARAEERAGKLNVVLILADDLGWADLGCYGSTFHRTPHLDRLAAAGLRFTNAYAACPVCSPTRAALMTGKVPARLHLTDWLPGRPDRPDQKLLRPVIRQHLPREETTLAEVFKAAGYATGLIGKWHLGGEAFRPEKRGFDVNVAGDEAGSPRSYFAPFGSKQRGREKFRFMPGLEKAAPGEYLTDRLALEAERFLQDHKDKPFFLYLPHYAVHIPMRAKDDLIAKYPNRPKPGTQSNPIYAAMLQSLDEAVGRVLKKLEKLKLADRTLVIFTSDNGGLSVEEGPDTPPTINSPLRESKGFLYEGGIRVPLLVRWPGVIRPGRVSDVPVISHDLFPTLVEACGLKHEGKVDGVSLAKLWKGNAAPERDALYWHYPHYANQDSRPGGAIREGSYKLIEFFENGRLELYDLKADVSETRNLAEDKKELTQRLAKKLATWRKNVGAQMPKPNPDYRPNPQAADGSVTLPARTAEVHGRQLRYEPLPHKNTLGFWTRQEDHASWEFVLTMPGTFRVRVLQGCGPGQGGSVVEVAVAGQTIVFTVEDTGGFQAFKTRSIGQVKLDKPGRYTLTVRPRSKAKAAVMDLRQVTLTLVKE